MFQVRARTRPVSVLLILLIVLLLAVGCSSGGDTAFESPLTAVVSPLPVPAGAGMRPEIPEPGTDTGVLVGQLFSTSMNDLLAVYPVYLGEILPLEPGDEYLITLKEQESPKVETDEQGYVIFRDIPPGEYALIVWLPFASAVVPDPANPDKELRVEVIAGEVTDFGSASVDFP